MTKAIISNRIYFKPPDEKTLIEVTANLTYTIEHFIGGTGKTSRTKRLEIIKNYKILPGGILSIPQGRTDLIPSGYAIEDKRVLNEVPFPNTKFGLRESQVPIYESVDDTCFINALVGWGKTFTALHIARKLEQKTLVLVHNTFLRDQWKTEEEKLFGMSPGIIGSGVFDI
jgi:hypothetical protein